MFGRRVLLAAALVACGATGCFAQSEASDTPDQEAPRPSVSAQTQPSPEATRRLAAQNRLAYRLLERLEKEPTAGENIVVSPASVAMALSLLELGADEKLRAAIAQALGYEVAGTRPAAAASKPTARGKQPVKPPAQAQQQRQQQPAKAVDDMKGLLQV